MKDIDFNIECWYSGGCPSQQRQGGCCNKKICHRYLEMNYLMVNCGMPNASDYLFDVTPAKVDLKTFKELFKIKNNIKEYVQQGFNLYIHSNAIGSGKTIIGLKMLYKYFDLVWNGNGFRPRGYFIHVPTILGKINMPEFRYSEDYKDMLNNLYNVDLVIWDDIGVYPLTPAEMKFIDSILSMRSLRNTSNVFTGSEYDKGLSSLVGSRISQRIQSGLIYEIKHYCNKTKLVRPNETNYNQENYENQRRLGKDVSDMQNSNSEPTGIDEDK